jgi:hypothetical protein
MAEGRGTEYSSFWMELSEEELWMLFSAVSEFCDKEMEYCDMSFEVERSPDSQREARAKAWSWRRSWKSQSMSSPNMSAVPRFDR